MSRWDPHEPWGSCSAFLASPPWCRRAAWPSSRGRIRENTVQKEKAQTGSQL